MSRILLLTALLNCLALSWAAGPDHASLRDAWLQAPESQGAHWNRVSLLDRLVAGVRMEGMPRAKVLDLLGPPGYSAEMYPGDTRIDVYRLSAANHRSLRLDYQADSTLIGDSIEDDPCDCDSCTSGAPMLPAAALRKELSTTQTMSGIEQSLGRPGDLHVTRESVGGQAWLAYSETWRVAGAPHRFLIVSGNVPARTAPTGVVADKPAGSWAVVTFAPACLAK
jgi:hypothetical protein